MLEVCLCKPAIYKLKILGGGGDLNTINQWREPQKGGGTKFLKFSGGSKRGGGDFDFWLKFSGGKNLGGNYGIAKRHI